MAIITGNRAKELARALDFVSFILLNLSDKEISKIRQILFLKEGQIFIDIISETKELKNKISSIAKQFPYAFDFKLGKVENFKKLPSKLLVLYGTYQRKPKEGKAKVLISWEVIKPDSKRVLLNKRLFGYTHSGKPYPGLLQKYRGEKLGKGCIYIPAEYAEYFLRLFKEMGISIKVKEVFEPYA